MVKCLASKSAHALKVTIFIELLPKLSGMKDKINIFHWEVKESSSNFNQLRNSCLNIGHGCECWSISKNLSWPTIFVVHNNIFQCAHKIYLQESDQIFLVFQYHCQNKNVLTIDMQRKVFIKCLPCGILLLLFVVLIEEDFFYLDHVKLSMGFFFILSG